jgi:hypothetical protein
VVVGNPDLCRTEAEIYGAGDTDSEPIALVHESPAGWQVEPIGNSAAVPADLGEILRTGQEALGPYVNRRGENRPDGLTIAGLSLWLMEKADGTAMGIRLR